MLDSPGLVSWEELKAGLMDLPEETLVEMISMWVKNYWTLQSYWMVFVERDYGIDSAARLGACLLNLGAVGF